MVLWWKRRYDSLWFCVLDSYMSPFESAICPLFKKKTIKKIKHFIILTILLQTFGHRSIVKGLEGDKSLSLALPMVCQLC